MPTHTFVLRSHIEPDILDTYVLGEIDPADADVVDEHLSACEACRHLVTQAEWAVALAATTALRRSGVLAVHATAEGPVILTVRKIAHGWWARVRGPFAGNEVTMTQAEHARMWCADTFRSAYPDHACTADCRYYDGTSAD